MGRIDGLANSIRFDPIGCACCGAFDGCPLQGVLGYDTYGYVKLTGSSTLERQSRCYLRWLRGRDKTPVELAERLKMHPNQIQVASRTAQDTPPNYTDADARVEAMGPGIRPPTALIAEDEALLRAELKRSLATVWPELVICAEAEDGIDAIQALDARTPDILFLDIQMPGTSGIDVARHASGRSHVVFVTAYDKYAVAAFDEGAVDYLLKPLSTERLEIAVARLKERLHSTPATLDGILSALAANAPRKSYLRWVTLARGNELDLITVDEVCYFQADHKYTLVFTSTLESVIRKPIRELIEELDPDIFWQIHRSTLVNVNAIAGIARDLRGHMRVRLKQRKESLSVSETFAHRFRQL